MRLLLLLAVICALAACAVTPDGVVDHAFGFDVHYDGQDAEVLDYRYGNSKLPVRAPEEAVKQGRVFSSTHVQGEMLRGEFLYVKWRNKSTGQVYEDNVDIRKRLPGDMKEKLVYFMIRGAQLFVYVISLKEQRPNDVAYDGPRAYRSLKTVRIYPE